MAQGSGIVGFEGAWMTRRPACLTRGDLIWTTRYITFTANGPGTSGSY